MSVLMRAVPITAETIGMAGKNSIPPPNGNLVDSAPYGNKLAELSTGTFELTNSADAASDHYNRLKILIAPSGFKESLGPEQIADAIETGVRRVFKQADVHKLPLHDGGEGFCKALISARHGVLQEATVVGPIGHSVHSHLGFIDDGKTAVLDMAAAAGLRLVPKTMRNPTMATTYGVGQLIVLALNHGCRKIIIGCGDSGTSDGGAGMLQALGAKLLDKTGNELPLAGGGQSLTKLDRISWDSIHPRLRNDAEEGVQIEAVCNIKNVLCGPKGVAYVYGPQKGATPEQVEQLANAMERFADVARIGGHGEIGTTPGSGASGGLGAAIMLLGGRLRSRVEAIDEYFGLGRIFRNRWDLVITAEGCIDFQSPQGKMTTEVARRAQVHGAQVVALAGTLGDGAEDCHDAGIHAFTSIMKGPTSLEDAIAKTEKLVQDGAERMMRAIETGLVLGNGPGMHSLGGDNQDLGSKTKTGRRMYSPRGLSQTSGDVGCNIVMERCNRW